MGSKKELGRARRRWETTVAPAEKALKAIEGFTLGMEMAPSMRSSPAAQASQRAVNRWKQHHRTIYTVDPDLQIEVVRSGLPADTIPNEVFYRLPHVTPLFILANPIPVDDPEADAPLLYDMFFANVTDDYVVHADTGKFLPIPRPLLRFVWFGYSTQNPQEYVFTTSSIHLTDDVNLHESLENILTEISPSAGQTAEISKKIRGDNWEDLNRSLFPLSTMLTLYACSQEPDLSPIKPPAILTQSRQRPERYEMHNLGIRVGSAIRAAKRPRSDTTRSSDGSRTVIPHMRKAHWHRFWTGPRDTPTKRKLVLRWIPPVAVNIKQGTIEPTVHPIRTPVTKTS
jgi:hypothetical protein